MKIYLIYYCNIFSFVIELGRGDNVSATDDNLIDEKYRYVTIIVFLRYKLYND